eukprot:3729737-Rhodomonas_salina.1
MGKADGCPRATQEIRDGMSLADSPHEALPLRRRPAGRAHTKCCPGEGPPHASPQATAVGVPRTVALDIETTGLNRYSEKITVVCLYGHIDPASQRIASRTFNMLTG